MPVHAASETVKPSLAIPDDELFFPRVEPEEPESAAPTREPERQRYPDPEPEPRPAARPFADAVEELRGIEFDAEHKGFLRV